MVLCMSDIVHRSVYVLGPRKVQVDRHGRAYVWLGKDFIKLKGKKVMIELIVLE